MRYDVATGKRFLIKEKSRKVHHKSGLFARKLKLQRSSRNLENDFKKALKEVNNERHIGSTAENYTQYTKLHLEFLDRRIELYKKPKFRRFNFESYIRRRGTVDRIVSNLCPKNARTLIFYGSSKSAPFIKGDAFYFTSR